MTSYIEGDKVFSPPPDWVQWFIKLGLNFPVSSPSSGRTILMVSTPCDSPAAGLVSLGIVMRDLAREKATNVENHAQAVRAWARQYLSWCKACNSRCIPSQRGCGYAGEASGEIFEVGDNANRHRKRFSVESLDQEGTLTLSEAPRTNARKGAITMRFGAGQNPDGVLAHFFPDGWPPPEATRDTRGLNVTPYSLLVPGWIPLEKNSRQSYSGACLVGRRTGTTDTRRVLEKVGFELNGNRHTLCGLLSIMGWDGDTVSRLRYYNSRRGNGFGFDRPGSMPEVAVVDGAREIAGVIAGTMDFGMSSLIGIVSRDADTKDLQELRVALTERRFKSQPDRRPCQDPVPLGISIQWMTAR